MTLQETATMMQSDDYRERFKAEYFQLKIRYDKLLAFVHNIELSQFANYKGIQIAEPKHDCPVSLLRRQLRVMEEYILVLETRAKVEEIELEIS